ncbi:MAG: hypothetical protein HC809_15905, partial [Gammaproteobacteria bacterium]|nr:hypothetical protein [Gammaproteobacteria bacterium]
MKVSVDVDLTPEELRRLFGLPDLAPIQNLVIDRITAQVEKGLDSGVMATLTRSLITGGLQSWDAYQKMLSSLLNTSTPRSAAPEPRRPDG